MTSELWGAKGEAWKPDGRLPEFSFAGYQCGERPIPDLPVAGTVRDFGAKGDGIADDTAAFNRAIAGTPAGAVLVPAGRYRITGFVTIAKPGLVLRGEGPAASVLLFDRPLTEVKPNWGATTTGERTSNYSWSGGYFVIQGDLRPGPAIRVTAEAKRGACTVAVASTAGLAAGRWVEIQVQDDAARSLTAFLYNGDPGSITALQPAHTRQPARIAAIDAATRQVRLDRPLRFDLRAAWQPRLATLDPSVTESGIERLRFEFPAAPWHGEFSELGYNAIELTGVAHCWIRDVRIHNAESGIYASGMHCTLAGIVFTAKKPVATQEKYMAPEGCVGHHGLTTNGPDNLVTGFDFQACYVHDLTVEGFSAAGNVYAGGMGRDLCFDHHRKAPHANLFTNLDCGAGNRIWRSGGGAHLGQHCAGWETFWNLRAAKPLAPPPKGWGAATMNLVGLAGTAPAAAGPGQWWVEPIPPAAVEPRDLHAAQLARRLASSAR
ncbi:MAG: glycosyl hydrolase family 28-related protein [Lentisphaeria bacterium]|jgi:hypothetical protein